MKKTRVCVSNTFTRPVTSSQTTKVTWDWTVPQGVPLFQSHLLWADFNTTELCVWEFKIVKACRLPPVLIFVLYSHPLQLSEIGCMPPPTPIALPSITPRWQQTDTSSHSHSALNITLLQSATTAIAAHTYLPCSFVSIYVINCTLCFFFFSGIRRLWCNKALNCLCISPQSCVAILFARKVLANRGATILSIQCLTLNFNTRSPAYRFHRIQVSF